MDQLPEEHEKALANILKKTKADFTNWVGQVSDSELAYVEWLLGKADGILDEMVLEKFGLTEATNVLNNIIKKL